MSEESLKQQIEKYGSEEKYREHLAAGFSNEQAIADVFKWYGSKEKAMEAMMQSTGDVREWKQERDKNAEIYKKFMAARETGDADVEKEAVEQLAENYKEMFKLDNARNGKELFSKGVFPWVGESTLGSYFVSVTSSHYDWAMKK